MASTYTTNLGIEKIGTGEQSGTWGETTNLNFDILDQAINGLVSVTLPATGSTGSPRVLAITDGALSDGRNAFIEFVDSGDLGGTAYVQLTPNDAEKIAYVRNSLSGGQSVILFQGTYNASNDFELANGKDALLYFNGGGSGAVVAVVQANEVRSGSFQVDNIVLDGNTIDVDGDLDVDVSDGDIVLKDDGTTFGGLSIGGTDTDNLVIKSGSTPTAALTLHEGNVGFGTQDEASYLIDAQSASAGIQARFISTEAGATSGPDLKFYRNSASPADSDIISTFYFNANTDDGAGGVSLSDVNYGSIVFNAVETNETLGEAAGFALNLKRGGTTQQYISIVGGTTGDTDNDSITLSTGGTAAITIDNSQNVTFDTNTLFVDAEDNRVGIGNVEPATALDVTGTVTADELTVDNINIDGNAITSTDTNGNIALTPDGTGEVDISKVDIDSGTIDDTTIGGSTPAAGSFTTGQFDTSLNVDGTVTADGLTVDATVANLQKTAGNTILRFTNHAGSQDAVAEIETNRTELSGSNSEIYLNTNDGTSTKKRLRIEDNGNISFREDTGTTPKFYWDATAESLGIGAYPPSSNYAPLSIKTDSTITTPSTFTNAANIWNPTTAGSYSNITFGYNTLGLTNAAAYMGFVSTSASGNGKGDLVFGTRDVTTDTAATERMRIDSSGRLLLDETQSRGTNVVSIMQTQGSHAFTTTNNEVAGFVGLNSNADNSLAIGADPDNLRAGSHIIFYMDGLNEAMRIDGSNNLNMTAGTGNIVMASGAGIDFSATANGSGTTSSELLDDYEEGTWTPELERLSGGSDYTFTLQNGFYTKIGNIVHVQFAMTISAITTQGSRFLRVDGLPFTPKNSPLQYSGGSVTNQGCISGEPCSSIGVVVNNPYLYMFATGNPTVNEGLLGETGANSVTVIAGSLVGGITYQV